MKNKDIVVFRTVFSSKIFLLSTTCLVWWLSTMSLQAQQVDFVQHVAWSDILQRAQTEQKIIFVDVYTDWCGPCKMMDRDVFTDAKLAGYFNDSFISYKINAEKEGVDFARQYGAKAFPNLYFIDTDGSVLVNQIGALSTQELLDQAMDLKSYWDNRDFLDQIDIHHADRYSLTEIEDILVRAKGFPFENKVAFAKRYLMESSPISDETLELTMDQMALFDKETLHHIAPMIGGFLPSLVINDRIGRKKIKWRNDMKTLMDRRMQASIKSGSFLDFEEAVGIHSMLGDIYEKDIDRFYLKYYRRNDLHHYATQAEYMVTKYLLAAPIEKVRQEDRRRRGVLLEVEAQQEANVLGVTGATDQLIAQSQTPYLDSIDQVYNISENIANQLFDISSDFFAFYEEELYWRKAEKWAKAACEYYPYDIKYFDNYQTILYSLGEEDKANAIDTYYKNLPWYDEMQVRRQQAQSDFLGQF